MILLFSSTIYVQNHCSKSKLNQAPLLTFNGSLVTFHTLYFALFFV